MDHGPWLLSVDLSCTNYVHKRGAKKAQTISVCLVLQFGEKLAKGAGNFNSPAEKTGKHLVYAKMLITEPKNISVCNSALCLLLQMRP